MLLYYEGLFDDCEYWRCGDYEWGMGFPNGLSDLKKMLEKIKAAGIIPGFHFLHTHIGIKSKYVTPVCDHRLNLTKYFTLARPLSEDDTVVFVEENPEGTVMHKDCRVLNFGGELIYYEAYTTDYPYCFTGCRRGHFDTNVKSHSMGTIGGILDISEFCAHSVYVNQNSSLQDEIANKLADVYNTGFEFVYFDGSEGTNPPFDFHIPNAQYRVYKKFDKKPIFCEGAAKSHFGWHMLSGGNAFDVFPMPVFKKKIAQFPISAAEEMKKNFTRVNFGWWRYDDETMPDIYEFGTSKAAAFDCPATMQVGTLCENLKSNPRTSDNFEVMRRWEDVRSKKWLTDEQKEMLKNPDKEFILLINEQGEYELCEYVKIHLSDEVENSVSAFFVKRKKNSCVVLWHKTGEGKILVNVTGIYKNELNGEEIQTEMTENGVVIPVFGRSYFVSDMNEEDIIKAFETAKLL